MLKCNNCVLIGISIDLDCLIVPSLQCRTRLVTRVIRYYYCCFNPDSRSFISRGEERECGDDSVKQQQPNSRFKADDVGDNIVHDQLFLWTL